jgi:hypothetical protein
MHTLLRQHGQGKTFVPCLDMVEARSGPYFADATGFTGTLEAGTFAVGHTVIHGGVMPVWASLGWAM